MTSNGVQTSDRRSSLTQTRARYQQIIQDLTSDIRPNNKLDRSSFSVNRRSMTEDDERKYHSDDDESEDNDETPENVRQYVKKFKDEVEVKYKESSVNQKYRIDANWKQESDNDSSMQSIQDQTRYDLASQNMLLKYGDQRNDYDASLLADFLIDVGKLDKTSLKSQLKSNESNVLKALLVNLNDKFLSDANQRNRQQAQDDFRKKEEAVFQQAKYLSSGNIGIQFGTKNTNMSGQGVKEAKKKRVMESLSPEVLQMGNRMGKKSSRGEKDSLKNSVHKETRINFQAETQVQSKSHLNHNLGISVSKESDKDHIKKQGKDKVNNLQNVHSYQIPTSPRTASRNGGHPRKLRNSISSRNRVPSASARTHLVSPTKQMTGLLTNNGLTRRSDLTLFTNNMLTSTLSPKSNLSSNTVRSNSRAKPRKAYPLKVITKKSVPRVSHGSSNHLHIGSSQLLSKIKRSGDDTSKATHTSSINVKQKIITRITTGGGYTHKKKDRANVVSPSYSNKQHSAKAGLSSRSKEASNDCSKRRRRIETETTAHSGIPGLQHVICMQPSSHHSGPVSLSKTNWRRRLEHMI